jgi:hypothetical protein
MSDFYSVLKQSIVDRGLRSPAQREEVYGQARAAMIRQLWSYDPPLAEDEIDARIGAFDRTVERIEVDIVATFADAPARRPPAPARPASARQASVVEGYDDEADYAPAGVPPPRRAAAPSRPANAPAPRPEAPRARRHDPLAERSAAIEEALRGDYAGGEEAEPDPETLPEEETPAYAEREYEAWHAPDEEEYEADAFPEEEAGRHEEEPDHGDAPRQGSRSTRRPRAAVPWRMPAAQGWWARLSEKAKIRALIGAIAALGVVLVVAAVAVIGPRFAGGPAIVAETPPKAEGAVTTSAQAATTVAAENADVVQSFMLFDGSDPTVFESAPDNPVRFDTDSGGGGFARISSSTGSPGVRLNIGPGIANRLAGEPVRVVITARSAKDNGAANMRFAYQSGVALSHWQSADLAGADTSYGLVWRVPKIQTDPNGDYLLIEPGIPGDGTAADIRSVRLDLLAKEPG